MFRDVLAIVVQAHVDRCSGWPDSATTWTSSHLPSSGKRRHHAAADLRCRRCGTPTGAEVNRITAALTTGNWIECRRQSPRNACSSVVGGPIGGTTVSVKFRRAPSAKWTSSINWHMSNIGLANYSNPRRMTLLTSSLQILVNWLTILNPRYL